MEIKTAHGYLKINLTPEQRNTYETMKEQGIAPTPGKDFNLAFPLVERITEISNSDNSFKRISGQLANKVKLSDKYEYSDFFSISGNKLVDLAIVFAEHNIPVSVVYSELEKDGKIYKNVHSITDNRSIEKIENMYKNEKKYNY